MVATVGKEGHTQLDYISAYIFKSSIDLLSNKLSGDNKDVLHAEGVLCSESGCSCEGINTVSCQNSLVSLETADD